jgi:hypothetical protein
MLELERIYHALNLGDFESTRPCFEAYLMRVRGYRKNRYPTDPKDIGLVEQHWGTFIERFGYVRPSDQLS